MPRTALALNKVTINGRMYWRVTVPLEPTGRSFRTFKDREKAEALYEALRRAQGDRAQFDLVVNEELSRDAVAAFRILEGTGATLAEAAGAFVRAKRRSKREVPKK